MSAAVLVRPSEIEPPASERVPPLEELRTVCVRGARSSERVDERRARLRRWV